MEESVLISEVSWFQMVLCTGFNRVMIWRCVPIREVFSFQGVLIREVPFYTYMYSNFQRQLNSHTCVLSCWWAVLYVHCYHSMWHTRRPHLLAGMWTLAFDDRCVVTGEWEECVGGGGVSWKEPNLSLAFGLHTKKTHNTHTLLHSTMSILEGIYTHTTLVSPRECP